MNQSLSGKPGAVHSHILQGHDGDVYSAAFSPDGKAIVTASYDDTARVWAKDQNGIWHSQILKGHDSPVNTAAFSTDGNAIVTASVDNTARVWPVSLLQPDTMRAFAAKENEASDYTPIIKEACAVLLSQPLLDKEVGKEQYPLAEITEADIDAAPILRSPGIKEGYNVCTDDAPGLVDRLLTASLPRRWWSGLDW